VLVHNAFGFVTGPLAAATNGDYEHTFTGNAQATFVALREAARRMRDGGRIVFMSSTATRMNTPESALYAASKAAGEQLVRVFAQEVGPRGITVNSVLPGATATEGLAERDLSSAVIADFVARTPLGRLGHPSDIADVVGFLASDAARWITGQSIAVDGGRSLSNG
jgi:3-oxoacyl-[acyl-carrier protein] reductase